MPCPRDFKLHRRFGFRTQEVIDFKGKLVSTVNPTNPRSERKPSAIVYKHTKIYLTILDAYFIIVIK